MNRNLVLFQEQFHAELSLEMFLRYAELGRAGSVENRETRSTTGQVWEIKLKQLSDLQETRNSDDLPTNLTQCQKGHATHVRK